MNNETSDHAGHHNNEVLANTSRVEAYSDAIIAIIMTLLVLDLKVPHIVNATPAALMGALREVGPNFLAFVLSFATLAVVWINHHHFFHPIRGTNRGLLWINNGLLFWVCVIPFSASLLGNYPTSPVTVGLYGASMFLVAGMFSVLVRYVFFHSDLVGKTVPLSRRQREFKRSCLGPVAYAIGTILSVYFPWAALIIYVLVPIYYIFPNTLE